MLLNGAPYRLAIALIVGLIGAGGRALPPAAHAPGDVVVAVRGGRLDMPDRLAAGWRRVRVVEDGAGHIVVAFRLRHGDAPGLVHRFLADLDTAVATPAAALALGGPEIGDSGEVVLDLRPGTYVFACLSRGKGVHRHGAAGEWHVVTVSGKPDPVASPRVADTVRLADFAYLSADRWAPGERIIRVENVGRQDHQLRIDRLRPGTTISQWLDPENPAANGKPVVGVARMGPGAVAYLPVNLPPSDYVMYCLVTDPVSRQIHVMRGMFKLIRVGDAPSVHR